MKTTAGTKTQSAALIPNSVTWATNAVTFPFNPPLTTYADPDSATWTQATLDTMQIGYKLTATNTRTIAISNILLPLTMPLQQQQGNYCNSNHKDVHLFPSINERW
jgi:hypothetical protein